jgi:predicted alpha/beta hydrolase family esterase
MMTRNGRLATPRTGLGAGPPSDARAGRTARILNVPGLDNSGPAHWQTRWEQRYPWFARVELGLWQQPDRAVWVQRLDKAIRAADGPVILVAHSLGCLAVAWWAALHKVGYREPVAGALLVAPADAERNGACSRVARFGPVPGHPLPFPSILVASRNDPHAAFDRSARFARSWGSHLVDAGDAGHLNADSGLGDWPLGISLVDRLVEAASLAGDVDRGLAEAARFLSIGASAPGAESLPW